MKTNNMKRINTLYIAIVCLCFASCKQKPTLQSYFVNHQEMQNFMTVDIPASILKINTDSLDAIQKKAYNSINKINVLTYSLKAQNIENFNNEVKTVNTILKNEKYFELLRAGNNIDGKILIKYIGNDTEIDELIIFTSAKNKGFLIARVLGNKMKPKEILSLKSVISKIDINSSELNLIKNFFYN